MPEDFKEEVISGSLGLVANGAPYDYKSPKLIVLLNSLKQEEDLDADTIRTIFKNAGDSIGCSNDLINRFSDYFISNSEY